MKDVLNEDDRRDREYREIVASLPTRAEIFLPTDKLSPDEKLDGIRIVRDIYRDRLDTVYRPQLRALREQYKGRKRCFVIGNGPSLKRTDLSVLKDEVTFAVNGFFLKARDLDWNPTFYVVEDHLVAEDRRRWINELRGSTKLFPVYLGYCLNEGDDTIFFNHRPRKSFPDGFDFSTDAADKTYTGCTVTFTCMQLAFYLGFEEIYLIGVDASYDLPKDVQQADSYSVGVLDMKSDDPNHFHPDYFGKGFRWHDPQVQKMVEAYQEARRVTDGTTQTIYNATVGGQLEVFERRAFADLFPNARPPDVVEAENERVLAERIVAPRILVLDLTARGDGTATGELKDNIFAQWPGDNYLQVYNRGGGWLGVQRGSTADEDGYQYPHDIIELEKLVNEFDPELILYRPVPNAPALHAFAMHTIASRPSVPLATWIMDDWLALTEEDDPAQYTALNRDWLWLLDRSSLRLSISQSMSAAFKERYGYEFQPFANGVDPAEWNDAQATPKKELVIRYAGGLAGNMGARSVLRVAEAVERLHAEGHPIRLEIQTRELWKKRQEAKYAAFKQTSFATEMMSPDEYRSWLNSAGAVLIAYNFDDDSLRYVRYSMANKLPECLASAAPLIVHGPLEAATVSRVADQDCALVLDSPDLETVKAGLVKLLDIPFRKALAERGQSVAFEQYDIGKIRRDLMQAMTDASQSGVPMQDRADLLNYPPSTGRSVDETRALVDLLSAKDGKNSVMIDIGARAGTSAGLFDDLGWRVYCFEPDRGARAQLAKHFDGNPRVTVDAWSVGQAAGAGSTTVADVVRQRDLDRIDVLRVGMEEAGLAVLKGVPWDDVTPTVIEYGFDDAKAEERGSTCTNIADFLVGKGYTVYVSEWQPATQHPQQRDWHRLFRYSSKAETPGTVEASGTLLAFREDPGQAAVTDAFLDNLVGRELLAARARRAGAGLPRGLYRRFVSALQSRSAKAYRIGQLAASAQRTLWHHRRTLGLLVLALLLLPLLMLPVAPPWVVAVAATWSALLIGGLVFALMFRRYLDDKVSTAVREALQASRKADRKTS